MLRPARLIGTVAALRNQAFQPHAAGGPKQVGADLALFEWRDEDASGRRASSRARLVLRIDSGRPRKSSPSSARISKA